MIRGWRLWGHPTHNVNAQNRWSAAPLTAFVPRKVTAGAAEGYFRTLCTFIGQLLWYRKSWRLAPVVRAGQKVRFGTRIARLSLKGIR